MNGTITLTAVELLAIACLPLGALSSVLKRVVVGRIEQALGSNSGEQN